MAMPWTMLARADPSREYLRRDFWALSAGESERVLMDLLPGAPHGEVTTKLSAYMGATKFTKCMVLRSAIPPDWDDAIRCESKES
jgi:hypothetical protein